MEPNTQHQNLYSAERPDTNDLSETIEFNRILLENAPFAIDLLNARGKTVYCNQANLDLFEVETYPEYQRLGAAVQPDYQPNGELTVDFLNERLAEARANKMSQFDITYLTRCGRAFPARSTFVHLKRQDEDMYVEYVYDMSLIHEAAEKNLQNQLEATSRLMLDYSPSLIEVWTLEGLVIDCNISSMHFLDASTKEEYCQIVNEGTGEADDLERHQQVCRDWASEITLIAQQRQRSFEWTEQHPDGRVCTYEIEAFALNLWGVDVIITYATDVSEIRKLQAEQRKIELIQESNRAKTRFLARMSHEIRTPLSNILGTSEIQLKNTQTDPDAKEAFDRIHRSSQILLRIVNDILDLSKIESGKLTLYPEDYEVVHLISDAIYAQSQYLSDKNLDFSLTVDPQLPRVIRGDLVRIEQIVVNLLSNALKYTYAGHVKLCVWPEHREQTGAFELCLSVSDTGLGMSQDQIDSLRTEYTRLHESDNRSVEGTGLGMSIIYSLVGMMKGRIDIDSQPGVGTTVNVRIPQQTRSGEVIGEQTAEQLSRLELNAHTGERYFTATPVPLPHGRVLVVDDVPINLHVTSGLLSFYELQIETCESGMQAIEKIRSGQVYDIVFMDHMMPEMDGVETLEVLRELGYTGTIIALTANAVIGQAEFFMGAGFDAFMSKPIQTSYLDTLLQRYIKPSQAGSAPQATVGEATDSNATKSMAGYMNSPELLDKIRQNFAKEHATIAHDMSQAVSVGDTQTAHRLAHTLKGLADLMQESTTRDCAAKIEAMIRQNQTPPAELLEQLSQLVTQILDGITIVERPSNAGNELAPDEASALLDQLHPLVVASDMSALQLLPQLERIAGAEQLCEALDNLDFKQALACLNGLR